MAQDALWRTLLTMVSIRFIAKSNNDLSRAQSMPASSAVMIPRGWVLPRPTANPGVTYDLEPVPDLPVSGPERDGRGTMGDTVENRL